MAQSPAAALPHVDKFFQYSLLGLLTSGYFAVVGSGYLDLPTVIVTAAALLIRTLLVAELPTLRFPPLVVTAATLAYFGFYPLDYFYLSKSFIPATVHLVFFVAVVKILTASTERDYLYLKVIAFLELLAACVLSSSFNFFLFLTLFLLLAVATFSSAEIRRAALEATGSSRAVQRGLEWRLSGVVAFVSLAILSITAGLFFFLPRTARAAFQHLVSNRYHVAGFSSEVALGRTGEIRRENTAVMHVRMDLNQDRPLVLKWRGAALAEFDGRKWFNRYGYASAQTLRPDSSGLLWLAPNRRERDDQRHISYAVHLNDIASDALFFAGTPQFLRIDSAVIRYPSGNFRLRSPGVQGVWYQVYSRLEPPRSELVDAAAEALPPAQREAYLRLPPIDRRIPTLAKRLAATERTPAEQARAIEQYLRTRYTYTLDLPQTEPVDPLADFLFVRKRGYCEYFASSLAVMLRTLEIPSRVVTGFQSGVYNPISGWQLIRASDAHSWVEAYLPYRGWTTFDPTPPDPNPPELSLWTRLGFYTDAAEVFWQDWVINYNLDRQLLLASRMEESSRRVRFNWIEELGSNLARFKNLIFAFLRRFGALILAFCALAALAGRYGRETWQWWQTRKRVQKARRGQGQASDATVLYIRMLKLLKQRGIEKPAWLTPVEFARVVPEPELALVVEALTSAYNDLRFGGNPGAAGRMVELLGRLETAL